MSTSPELIREGDDRQVRAARLDSDLRTSPFGARSSLSRFGADPRLVDARLEPAFDELVRAAETTARAEGFANGLAEGRAAALVEQARRTAQLEVEHDRIVIEDRRLLGRALDALDQAVSQWEQRVVPVQQELEVRALDLALEIVRELAGVIPEVVERAVTRTLELSEGVPGEVLLKLHPEDATRIAPTLVDRQIRVVGDPTIDPGGCYAEVGGRRVDARLSTTLGRLREALS